MTPEDLDQDHGSQFATGTRHLATDPLARLAAEHTLQLELCDALEFIADGLPDQIDRRLVREATAVLEHGLSAHHKFEEEELFPALRRGAAIDTSLLAALAQLEKEHVRDDGMSQEIAEELRVLAEQGCARNAEMLGYMLRGYFDSQRRHIEWENTLVLPLARRVLSGDDLQELSKRMAASVLRPAPLDSCRRGTRQSRSEAGG